MDVDERHELSGIYSSKQEVDEAEKDDGRWAAQVSNDHLQADEDADEDEDADDLNKMSDVCRSYEHLKAEEANEESCRDKLNRCKCPEKTVYMLAVISLIVVVASTTSFRWFLPYFYTILLSVVIPIRAWKYSTMKWQFFLFDWCYIANVLNLVYLWGVPHKSRFFLVVYSVCNGPVAWSVVIFRNCLVPHSIERMTCLTIHFLPAIVMFAVRWYPTDTSLHWYKSFPDLSLTDIPLGWDFLWLFAVPLATYMGHLVLYISLFHWLVGPSEYLNNYTYLVYQGDGWISKAIKCYGGKCKFLIYLLLQLAYSVVSILLTLLWFNFRVANILFLCAMFLVATYNGSTYYLDLFPKKGFNSDPYRLC